MDLADLTRPLLKGHLLQLVKDKERERSILTIRSGSWRISRSRIICAICARRLCSRRLLILCSRSLLILRGSRQGSRGRSQSGRSSSHSRPVRQRCKAGAIVDEPPQLWLDVFSDIVRVGLILDTIRAGLIQIVKTVVFAQLFSLSSQACILICTLCASFELVIPLQTVQRGPSAYRSNSIALEYFADGPVSICRQP